MSSSLQIDTVETTPFDDQRPGTSGLRKTVARFREPGYLENFLQSILDTLDTEPATTWRGRTVVLGGDGRYFSDHALQVFLSMAAANGVGRVVVGSRGHLSTPAASHLVRELHAGGALILTASHNPGGPDGDFGVKFNNAAGAPAPETVTAAVFACSRRIRRYRIARNPPLDLSRPGQVGIGAMPVEIIDPVAAYARLMERLFDFDAIHERIRTGRLRFCFDAMHGATGPYAREIFGNRLGCADDDLLRCDMREDFGGGHPDPGLATAAELTRRLFTPDGPDLGAASDGDGDRNMILGRGVFVSPGDSLAVLAAHATTVPAFAQGLRGVARSMPTSRAVDRVARDLQIPVYETPTGWKFFCNLLDDGRIDLCGEESFGTSGNHIREKDGVWAALFWLNLVAAHGRPVRELLARHWARYGRDHFLRHDYEALDSAQADAFIGALRASLPGLAGRPVNGAAVRHADEFRYTDPVDGTVSEHQGIRIAFEDGARIVYRLSGTGTQGATLRVYMERPEPDPAHQDREPERALADVIARAGAVAEIHRRLGRDRPDKAI